MMEGELSGVFELIRIGGDGALIAIAWAVFKMDRRLIRVEGKLSENGT